METLLFHLSIVLLSPISFSSLPSRVFYLDGIGLFDESNESSGLGIVRFLGVQDILY